LGQSASRFLALSCCTLLGSAACTVGPDYVRPSAAVPAAYKEAGDWKVASPGDEIERGAWWKMFREPVLDDLEAKVDISNQTVLLAEAQYRASLAAVGIAKAGYFPSVTAGASVVRSSPSQNLRGGTISTVPGGTATSALAPTSGNTTVFTIPLGLSWELDVWGRIRRGVESSRASAEASLADLESARLSAQALLAQDYFQLRALDSQKAILERAVADFEHVLEITKNRYDAGVASPADVLQAQSQLETARAQSLDIGVSRTQTEHAMAVLVGKPASSFSIGFAPSERSPPEIPLFIPSEILERRPDVAAAERRVAAANAQIGIAIAAYYPKLSLGATGGLTSTSFTNLFTTPSLFWSVGPSLAGTLFDGGARSSTVDQARATYEGTVATYRQTALVAFQDVEDNLAATRILEKESEAQARAVIDAKRAVTITLNQYRAGTVAYLDVLTAETNALTAERTAADILGRRMVTAVTLIKALGGGWKANEGAAPDAQLRK
jgi:NodT family efflux transporter outer membrane factor (OMF) lipoprotein